MTIFKKTVNIFLWMTVLSFNSCLSSSSKNEYLKSEGIQSKLDKTVTLLSEGVPMSKYITIYFTKDNEEIYVFVSTHLNLENITSSYYYEVHGKQIIVGYDNDKLEKSFANTNSKKNEKVFSYSDSEIDVFDGKRVVYKVLNDNAIQEINPIEEILELNDYGQVKFIAPNKELKK
jgi:hypothetical protein